MIIHTENLRKDWPERNIRKGKWALARPIDGPFIHRIKAAWKVLKGECDALKWEDQ